MVISPATTTRPVVSRRLARHPAHAGPRSRMASRMASETWSAILSGWPSVTDSDVNVYALLMLACSVLMCLPWRPRPILAQIAVADQIEHDPGQLRLVGERRRRSSRRRRRGGWRRWCRGSKPTPGAVTSLATIRSRRLRRSLSSAPARHVAGLGREAHQDLAGGACAGPSSARMSVRRLEHDLGHAVGLVQLVVGRRLGPEVGDRGGHDHHVGVAGPGQDGGLHLRGGLDPHDLDAGRRRPVGGGDQRDRGAPGRGLGGQRLALLARRAVAEEAHGVDRLAGAAGGDQDGAAGEILRREQPVDGGEDSRARPGGRRPRRRRPAGRRRARPRTRPAGAGWPGCRPWPGAPTSRCAWPGRRPPAPGWPAAWRSAGRRRCRPRTWPAAWRWPAPPG